MRARPIVCLAFLLFGCVTETTREKPKILSFWTELAPGNQQVLRVVLSAPPCPVVETEAGPLPLQPRSRPDADFPIQVCEARLALTARRARLDGIELPLLRKASPEKILILGDTGCRIKPDEAGESTIVQACNDPHAWPFAQIARAAAEWKPDLVIHVGDYHYREGRCPQGRRDCEGATAGDYWPSWEQDFMTPAEPLLRAAPWIAVRGNHESCVRAGKGWFLLMEPGAHGECQDRTERFGIEFPDRVFEVIDSNFGDHLGPSLAKIPTADKKFRWVLSHRPFLTPGGIEPKYQTTVPPALSAVGKLNLVLAGHWHFLSLNTIAAQGAPEFIVGNGGTMLDEDRDPFRKQKGVATVGFPDFGFVTMQAQKKGRWSLHVHDRDGKIVKTCEFRESLAQASRLNCH